MSPRDILRRLLPPRAPQTDQLEEALEVIDYQAATIRRQAEHIKALDERITKLEAENRDLAALI